MNFLSTLSSQIHSISTMAILVKAIVNLIFASAVAHDGGLLLKSGRKTALVSPMTWAFATLLGGVIAAAIYWFIHHALTHRRRLPGKAKKPLERGFVDS